MSILIGDIEDGNFGGDCDPEESGHIYVDAEGGIWVSAPRAQDDEAVIRPEDLDPDF